MTAIVHLKTKRAKPFFAQHPWVYPGAIDRVEGDPADGAEVELVSSAGDFIARGYYNSQSKLRVRLYSWEPSETLDADFFRRRIKRALRLRRETLHLGGPGQACRLLFSEADGLSGLIVDQYDRWLVVQFTSLALGQRRDVLADLLQELTGAEGIYLRTERGIGQLEGLQAQDSLLRGRVPAEPITIEEHGLRFLVRLTEGQKTGFYLDQRDNRRAVATLAKGRRVLDAFCYSGGFGLHASRAGAASVLGLDVSEPALDLARQNAQLNGLANLEFRRGDVFSLLDDLAAAGETFGLIILDPPKFARAGSAVDDALRGYRHLYSQALRLLGEDGILVACCCSGLIPRDMLHDLLAQVAVQARKSLQILETRGPSPDHPVAANCPETQYLKCVICRV